MGDELFDLFQEMDAESISGTRESIIKAPFGYPGGKSKSVLKILPHLPVRKTWAEVFGGSAALTLSRTKSPLEVYNDRFGGVCDFYRVIRDETLLYKLIERLDLTVHSREDFLLCRDTWENTQDIVERAARWYYMTEYSFGGQGRNFGRASKEKNPMSGKFKDKLPLFELIHKRMARVTIENQDWRFILKDFDSPDTVFYLDPPYYDSHDIFYKHAMSKQDHKEMLDMVFDCKGFVAVSGYHNELYGSYDWSKILSWKQTITAKSLAKTFDASNGYAANMKLEREQGTEMLYLKEAQ